MPRPGCIAGKRDKDRENAAQAWIEEVTGTKFTAPYEDYLRDGQVLCKLMNTLQPGAIPKINTSGGQFKMMENLTNFLKAAENYGVPRLDLFQTVDLFEKKDLCTVTNMLFALGGATYKHPEWTGARLGPKPADQNVREFSEETLAEGKKVIGLQAGTNKGASQSGQNFGNTRHIIIGK